MNEHVMYLLLKLIEEKASIGTLFKLGYSYSKIIKWYYELQSNGLICNVNNEYRSLTIDGKKKLKELEKKVSKRDIGKLEQYRIKKNSLEDIYLP